jgi:hypothetical protein
MKSIGTIIYAVQTNLQMKWQLMNKLTTEIPNMTFLPHVMSVTHDMYWLIAWK